MIGIMPWVTAHGDQTFWFREWVKYAADSNAPPALAATVSILDGGRTVEWSINSYGGEFIGDGRTKLTSTAMEACDRALAGYYGEDIFLFKKGLPVKQRSPK